MNKASVNHIFKTLKAANDTPTTELEYSTTFELLIAVILSAHTTDKSVNNATRKLFPLANTPQAIAHLKESGLKKYIQTIGLYNTKARNIINTCKILLDKHHGKVPSTREALEALPGVGRKTANVILNTAFGESTIAVDTHIFRVANRTGLAKSTTPLGVEKQLLQIIPKQYLKDAHHWLVLHGRYLCTARNPKCLQCPINKWCEYFKSMNNDA